MEPASEGAAANAVPMRAVDLDAAARARRTALWISHDRMATGERFRELAPADIAHLFELTDEVLELEARAGRARAAVRRRTRVGAAVAALLAGLVLAGLALATSAERAFLWWAWAIPLVVLLVGAVLFARTVRIPARTRGSGS